MGRSGICHHLSNMDCRSRQSKHCYHHYHPHHHHRRHHHVGRVINIPLTEASDSPKIAAWHMVPTEVTNFTFFLSLIFTFSRALSRAFSRAANQQCSIYMGWLILGDTRTGLTSIRWTSLDRIIAWKRSLDGVKLDRIIG